MKFFGLFISTLLVSASALDKPESLTEKHEHTKRDLQFFNGNQRCETQLSMCESIVGRLGIDERSQKWIDYLEALDGDETDTLIDDLQGIITNAAGADFSPFVDALSKVTRGEKAQLLINTARGVLASTRSIQGSDYELEIQMQEVADATEELYVAIEQTVGGLPAIDIQTVILLINFVVQLLQVYNDGPIAIIQLVFTTIVSYLGSLSINIMALNIFPNTESSCVSELMLCDYTKMMLTTIPALVGGLLLTAGSASVETPEPSGI